MNQDKILTVKSLLYDYSTDKVRSIISQINDQEVLYMYMYNYNWDNGFEIPQEILDNRKCTLSIALLIFYGADGISYLLEKTNDRRLPKWFLFIQNLYISILNGKYQSDIIAFKVPLSSVQVFKLKKVLTKEENIFISSIDGENLDIKL